MLEVLGMVVTAWVLIELVGDRADVKWVPIMMPGDNTQQYLGYLDAGGARDKLMRMSGCLKIKGGWNHVAKHIPGVRFTLAVGISRWPCVILEDKVGDLTNSDDRSEQDIGAQPG